MEEYALVPLNLESIWNFGEKADIAVKYGSFRDLVRYVKGVTRTRPEAVVDVLGLWVRNRDAKPLAPAWKKADRVTRRQLLRALNGGTSCRTCGSKVSSGSLCTFCWEVESRLGDYLQLPKGRALVQALLGDKSDDT